MFIDYLLTPLVNLQKMFNDTKPVNSLSFADDLVVKVLTVKMFN